MLPFHRLRQGRRCYNTLARQINVQRQKPALPRPPEKPDYSHDLQSTLLRARKVPETTERRLRFLREFIHGYMLDDEMLLYALYPSRDNFVGISDNENTVNIDTRSLEALGAQLFALQRTKAAMSLGMSEDPTKVFSSVIFKKCEKIATLNKFLHAKGFMKNVVLSSTLQDQNKQAQSAFFTLIGLLTYKHGMQRTADFLNLRIFSGHRNLFEIAARSS